MYNSKHIYKNISLIFFVYVSSSLITVTANDCDPSKSYPSVDQQGPSLTIPRSVMSKYLKCYPRKDHRKRWTLFLPGSTEQVYELFSWNWMRIMDEKQWPYCTLQLPEKGLGDLQVADEYIVYAVRKIYTRAQKEREEGLRKKVRINLVGHSLGGTLPRFSIRFWPDIRLMINHLIAYGPTNHGTTMADVACDLARCPTSVTQQRINSSFLCALNSYQETFSPIKYTNILSRYDEIVRPVESSEIHKENVTNIYIQDICPFRVFSEHLGAGIYDYCGYYLTINALLSRSLKNISNEKCCRQLLMPGINLTPTGFIAKVSYSAKEHAKHLLLHFGETRNEPALKCAFRTDCTRRKQRVPLTKLR